jgi:hypothetical protein
MSYINGAPNIQYAQGGWYSNSGFYYAALAAGVHTIDYDFASTATNKTAYLKDVCLEIWRIS